MLKVIAQNKYKLMVFIIGLYLLVDVLQHKGQTRILFPKNFPEPTNQVLLPSGSSLLISKDKIWKKAVNTKGLMDELGPDDAGFECDVYFDTTLKSFDVHHDAGKSIGYNLDILLHLYKQKHLQSSIWLDIKNLNNFNAAMAMQSLIELRNKYYMQDKILVESGRADLLTGFNDSGFFTSYYVPLFNPYKIDGRQAQLWADSITSVISRSKINSLSGYYFQSSFLAHYFSRYPVLTWIDNSSFSLVNLLFQKKITADKSIFIVLKP